MVDVAWFGGYSLAAVNEEERSLHHEENRCCGQQEKLLRSANGLFPNEILVARDHREPNREERHNARNEADKSNARSDVVFFRHASHPATCPAHYSQEL